MKRIIIFISLILCLVLNGCKSEDPPINVSFKNQTIMGGKTHTLTVVYAEDKRIRDKYTDILVKSDQENLTLNFAKELDSSKTINIENSGQWYSLTKLYDPSFSLTTFAKAQTTTYVFTSNKEAKLKFKVIGGDLNESENFQTLTNIFTVSKEFDMKAEKISQNT